MKSPVNAVEGEAVWEHRKRRMLLAEKENGETVTKDRRDSVIHLPESLPGVTAGNPEEKAFPDTKG